MPSPRCPAHTCLMCERVFPRALRLLLGRILVYHSKICSYGPASDVRSNMGSCSNDGGVFPLGFVVGAFGLKREYMKKIQIMTAASPSTLTGRATAMVSSGDRSDQVELSFVVDVAINNIRGRCDRWIRLVATDETPSCWTGNGVIRGSRCGFSGMADCSS